MAKNDKGNVWVLKDGVSLAAAGGLDTVEIAESLPDAVADLVGASPRYVAAFVERLSSLETAVLMRQVLAVRTAGLLELIELDESLAAEGESLPADLVREFQENKKATVQLSNIYERVKERAGLDSSDLPEICVRRVGEVVDGEYRVSFTAEVAVA